MAQAIPRGSNGDITNADRRRRQTSCRAARLAAALVLGLAAGCAGQTAVSGGGGAGPTAALDPLDRIGPEALFHHGQRLAKQGDAVRAEQYLSAAIQRGFPQGRALPLLLRVCVNSSRLGAALAYAEPYLRLHPGDYHLRYLVAAVQLALARPDAAERELRAVIRDAPDYAAAHYLLGVVLRDYRGDADAAAVEFEAHQRLDASGVHAAEVAAWLRDHARSAHAATPLRSVALPAQSAKVAQDGTTHAGRRRQAPSARPEPAAQPESGP